MFGHIPFFLNMHVHTVDTSDTDTTTSGPRTLRRGLQILRTLQENPESGLNVSSLARITGLQRPTVYRLLSSLVEHGLVKNVSGNKLFHATPNAENHARNTQ